MFSGFSSCSSAVISIYAGTDDAVSIESQPEIYLNSNALSVKQSSRISMAGYSLYCFEVSCPTDCIGQMIEMRYIHCRVMQTGDQFCFTGL